MSRGNKYIKSPPVLVLSVGLLALAGCAGIGPTTIVPSRFDYAGAIGDSWKQQLLINLVKIRYGDAPVFLEVASVISQFQVAVGANWAGTFNNQSSSNPQTYGLTGTAAAAPSAGANIGQTFGAPFISDSQVFGANVGYADRPTITYMPLSGEKFTRTLMKPIPPPSVLTMIQAGYPIDLVLRICTHSVNGIRNRYESTTRSHPADAEFYQLLERLQRIQNSGAMGLRVDKTKGMEAMMLVFRDNVSPDLKEDFAFVQKTLKLDPGVTDFRIAYGSIAKDGREIAILTRSVLEIFVDMASNIEVPLSHVEEKRVISTPPEDVVAGVPIAPLITIHSSRFRPGDAFLAVPYRNHWFWIDDRDMRSKSLFTFMLFLTSLTDTEGKEGAPILTVPTG